MVAKPEVNATMSGGVRFSPGNPPIVPRIPEIDFINVKVEFFLLKVPKLGYSAHIHLV